MNDQVNWDNYPKGVLGWVLWSLPRKAWRLTVWGIGLFLALTAVSAYHQLTSIRSSELEKTRSEIFMKEWKRDDSPQWKIALLSAWSRPWDIPESIWDEAIHHENLDLRKTVAKLEHTPPYFLDKLLFDKDYRVPLLAIFHKGREVNVRHCLANNLIRERLASINQTMEEILFQLVGDEDPSIRRLVASHPNASARILKALSDDDDDDVLQWVTHNSHTPAPTLKEFVFGKGRGNILVRRNVALNPNADADTIAMLSKDDDLTVISNLAQNPSTPDAVLSRLCEKHPNPYIHALVAAHPNASSRLLEALAAQDDQEYVLAKIAVNKNTPRHTVLELLSKDTFLINLELASSATTAPELLAKLAGHPDPEIRQAVAENEACPTYILSTLSDESSPVEVVAKVAANPSTPPGLLEELAKRGDKDIDGAIAGNRHAPESLLRSLSDLQQAEEVLQALASNPATPEDIMLNLAAAEYRSVRLKLATNPSTPGRIIDQMGKKENDVTIRAAVAAHPNISEGVLIDLLGDERKDVVIAALENILSRRKEFCNTNS